MKTAHLKPILILILVFTLVSFEKTKTEKPIGIPLAEAIEKNLIEVSFKSIGGYSGDCVMMKIKNLHTDTTYVIEPGRNLSSVDTVRQDLLVIRREKIFLAQNEEKELKLFAFCSQSFNGAPRKNDKYLSGKMTNDTVQEFANFLNQNKFKTSVVQSAVWVMMNNHAVSTISKGTNNENAELIRFVSKLKGVEIPWYSISFIKDSSVVFSNKPKELIGNFDYEIWQNSFVNLAVFNDKNQIVKQLFRQKPHNPDKHSYLVKLDLTKMPRGKYKVMLYSDSQEKLERYFEF